MPHVYIRKCYFFLITLNSFTQFLSLSLVLARSFAYRVGIIDLYLSVFFSFNLRFVLVSFIKC